MNLTIGLRNERSRTPAVLLLVAASCAIVLALASCSGSSGTKGALAAEPSKSGGRLAPEPPSLGSMYSLMQMNLCLSGLASCSRKVAYPAVVEEAVARIREAQPDAVTFNEGCRNDVALIARRTGYHLRFARVIYHGRPLPCVDPGGRGLFGDSVLTKAAIESTESKVFEAQAGPERREYLCVSTRVGVEVCTAHLASPETDEVAANAPQCAELRTLLARLAVHRSVIFGGDVNRRPSCAPQGFWSRTDRSAHQDPGSQHVYGAGALRSPSAEVIPAMHTDHDVLLVHAELTPQR